MPAFALADVSGLPGALRAASGPVHADPALSELAGQEAEQALFNDPDVLEPLLGKGESCPAAPRRLLSAIKHPSQVAGLTLPEMAQLAGEIRRTLISTVSRTGGHLAPSLGVVDLTIALLSVFNPERDKLIWDVGHQAYAYKLLTGRAEAFHTLRQMDGISGFPSRFESRFDHFGVGHSSTSVSAALGMAKARDLAGDDHHVVSIIGDGSLTAGLAYEALNQAGATARRFIVILNDNEMSISKNVGALSLFMSRNLSARWVRRVKREVEAFLTGIPGIGADLMEIARRSKHSFKNFFTPGILFEALRFNYIGPVDGHNLEELRKTLNLAAALDRPVLVHILTRKGKGYAPAEANPVLFHGIGSFEPKTGFAQSKAAGEGVSYTEAFSRGICALARADKRIIAITAAMPEGTGLTDFAARFPERFIDVGICEQHAVTMAAGLATQGFKPFVAVYSTFLQRAYDQIVHDVCLQKLPVTFCIDRAGLVGEDGPTHQGAFDLAYLRHIPNIVLFAPKDEAELQHGLATALAHDGPFALRWPRGLGSGAPLPWPARALPIGRGEVLVRGDGRLAVIALGSRVLPALHAAQRLQREEGVAVTVLNARFVKPLPEQDLRDMAESHEALLLLEEGCLAGGFSSAVLERLNDEGLLRGQRVQRLGLPDAFIEHGPAGALRKRLGLDEESIYQNIRHLAGII
ncbi:MAG: 1-deoxy-D-xylulose-5-phosphate synthase [Desulfovibrio sp.]|jgi:1-deoxy-D-xylulose-5-phosphate synthase|nr:1-deoxy-D-xylulose-5-phosphate synthase [Desulfovibrio sp.]